HAVRQRSRRRTEIHAPGRYAPRMCLAGHGTSLMRSLLPGHQDATKIPAPKKLVRASRLSVLSAPAGVTREEHRKDRQNADHQRKPNRRNPRPRNQEQNIRVAERERPAHRGPKRTVISDVPDGEGPQENSGPGAHLRCREKGHTEKHDHGGSFAKEFESEKARRGVERSFPDFTWKLSQTLDRPVPPGLIGGLSNLAKSNKRPERNRGRRHMAAAVAFSLCRRDLRLILPSLPIFFSLDCGPRAIKRAKQLP